MVHCHLRRYRYQVLGTKYQVQCTKYQVPGTFLPQAGFVVEFISYYEFLLRTLYPACRRQARYFLSRIHILL